MSKLRLGDNSIDSFFVGEEGVSAIYLGDELVWGGGELTPNTYIGGVADVITSPSDLASRLAISVDDIGFFRIVGNDVEARIMVNYIIPTTALRINTMTWYRDPEGMCTDFSDANGYIQISSNYFLEELYFPAAASHAKGPGVAVYGDIRGCKALYFPNALSWGFNEADEGIFASNLNGTPTLYVHPSLATSNNGGLEGDLAYAQSLGCDIRFVDNQTAPDAVMDLSIGTKYTTALQLNFTPPTSTNAIDYYEVYVDGVKYTEIQDSGEYITRLTIDTTYEITIVAVDEFYNKGLHSDILLGTTSAQAAVETSNLISSFGFEGATGAVVDSYGGIDGTISGSVIREVSGLVGNCFDFEGGKVVVPHNPLLNIGESDFAFSLCINWDSINNTALFNKRAGTSYEYQLYYANGDLMLVFFNTDNSTLQWSFNPEFVVGTKYIITGRLVGDIIEVMINGDLKQGVITGSRKTFNVTTTDLTIGQSVWNSNPFLGKMDELRLWIGSSVPDIGYFPDEFNNGNGITL